MERAHRVREAPSSQAWRHGRPSGDASAAHQSAGKTESGSYKPPRHAAVLPRGAFSAQMLRVPSTPTSSDSIHTVRSPQPEDDDDSSMNGYEYALESPQECPKPTPISADKLKSNRSALPPPQPSSIRCGSGGGRRQAETSQRIEGSSRTSASNSDGPVPGSSGAPMQFAKDSNESHHDKQHMPVPSVHPIDTLSKKLRQQAMELTRVYEELETQTQHVAKYKAQIQEQKLQLEHLRAQRRKPSSSSDSGAKSSSSSRMAALEQQKRAAQMMVGTPSTGASVAKKREQLDIKLKEVESEKKKFELASKRLEHVLVELQMFQNDRMEGILPPAGSSDQDVDADSFRVLVAEQSAYIHVLEEAVHLKATEFQVSGHDELLVVLAELRHTIYQQEKELEEKNQKLSTVQDQLLRQQQENQDARQEVVSLERQHEETTQLFHQKEAELRAQLDTAHRQLQQQQEQANRLRGVSVDAQKKEQSLQERLSAASKTQNASDAKLEDAARRLEELQKRVDTVTLEFEDVARQRDDLRDECAKKQAHLDEMNSLQEELLASMDSYVSKTERAHARIEQLEGQLEDRRQQEALTHQKTDKSMKDLEEQVQALREQVASANQSELETKARCAALQQERDTTEQLLAEARKDLEEQAQNGDTRLQELQDVEQECRRVQELVAELEAAVATALRMITEARPKQGQANGAVEADEHGGDATEEAAGSQAILIDTDALESFRTCCQALATLGDQDKAPQCSSLLPSFSVLVARVTEVGGALLGEVDCALASWSRERSDLLEACATLETTTHECREEMTTRHDELLECQYALMERTSEVEGYVLQLKSLDQQIRELQAECGGYQALQRHAMDLEAALESKRALLMDLTTENDRLQVVEREFANELAANEQRGQRLQDQQRAMKEQYQQIGELESALESAATLAEQQNESNRQLSSQLTEMKSSMRERSEAYGALEARHKALTDRFVALVRQYMLSLRPVATGNKALQETLAAFEEEMQHGDALGVLQMFPTLLEAYAESCSASPEQGEMVRPSHQDAAKQRRKPAKSAASSARFGAKLSREQPCPRRQTESVAASAWAAARHAGLTEKVATQPSLQSEAPRALSEESARQVDAHFEEQLELIRDAFRSYQ